MPSIPILGARVAPWPLAATLVASAAVVWAARHYGRDRADQILDWDHATSVALRTAGPDGSLDEEIYETTPPIGGLIQQEPHEGEPGTERTDVWIFFDDRNIYIAARCWDTHPERILANELRRDNINIFNNDNVTIAFDTFYDHRSGFFFQTNPLSAIRDGSVTNEQPNFDWNAVWNARSRRFKEGWTTEIVIPDRKSVV